MAAKFKKNDPVFHKRLKKEGTVIEVLKDGSFRIAMGALSMVCWESEINAISPDQWKKFSSHVQKPKFSRPEVAKPHDKDYFSVDVHGLTVAEAIPVVDKKLNEALVADLSRLEVIHGIGMGKLLTAVHKYLKGLSVVKHFELDKNNPGTTWVYF